VDWAHFGKRTVARAERDLWAFVMVLAYSRVRFLRFGLRAVFENRARPFRSACTPQVRRRARREPGSKSAREQDTEERGEADVPPDTWITVTARLYGSEPPFWKRVASLAGR
jgi:hypothetical protein